MTAQLIDGRVVAGKVRDETAARAAKLYADQGRRPGLATILVGEDPASRIYVARKRKLAREAGIEDFHLQLGADAEQSEIADRIAETAENDHVSGILLQLPLPAGLDSGPLIEAIPAHKDVDGLTVLSQGLLSKGAPGLRPCTPSGVMRLLRSVDVAIAGAEAVVVGRSELVGRPMAQMLLHANATVTVAHSRTRSLVDVTRRADILVVSAGIAGLIGAEHIKPGAVVIDVGIHRTETGLVGDVRLEEARETASFVTPVPGGVGPMTIAMLLANTVQAASARGAGEAA